MITKTGLEIIQERAGNDVIIVAVEEYEVNKMKVEELMSVAENELKDENQEKIVEMIKKSLKRVKAAKRTLKAMETAHTELLQTEVDDLDLDDYEY